MDEFKTIAEAAAAAVKAAEGMQGLVPCVQGPEEGPFTGFAWPAARIEELPEDAWRVPRS